MRGNRRHDVFGRTEGGQSKQTFHEGNVVAGAKGNDGGNGEAQEKRRHLLSERRYKAGVTSRGKTDDKRVTGNEKK